MKLNNFKDQIHPELYRKVKRLVRNCSDNGISIQFSEGFRTVERQNELYAQGRTKPGQIVTNARGTSYSSQHQWGIAIDFYLDMDIDGDGSKKDDAFNNIEGTFDEVGRLAIAAGLGWGGSWSKPDRPHLYLGDWGSTTSTLKSLYGSPERFIATWRDSNIDENKPEGGEKLTIEEFIRAIQYEIGAKIDGIAGKETLSKTPTLKRGSNNCKSVIVLVQRRLNAIHIDCGAADGIFGIKTETAVKNYQRSIGFQNPDGVMDSGKRTWRNMLSAGSNS